MHFFVLRVFALLEMVPIKLLELSPLARFTHLTYDKIYTNAADLASTIHLHVN